MNDDRISEVYKGEISTDLFQDRSRRRINWMCSQVGGKQVLDLGCSQGIASIILGREGFEVVGLDVQDSRIEYARRDLAQESAETRSRVTFMVGEGTDLDFDDESFDTVLLGEVLEHLVAPDRILEEVTRVLRQEGLVVITTPFGVLHHHDHKQTFFPRPLMSLIGSRFRVVSANVEEGYFRIVARKSPAGHGVPDQILDGLLDSTDVAVRGVQESLAEARTTLLAKDRELAEHARKSAGYMREKSELQVSIARLQATDDMRRDALTGLKQKNAKLTEIVAELRKQLADQRNSVKRLAGMVKAQRLRIGKLEHDRWKLRNDLALARWKLTSLKARRWWRLGVVLSQARRNPLLLGRALGVVFGRSSLPPRPELAPGPVPEPRRTEPKTDR
jgi:2-polyprenyl-6-hydroxyphenyl methylase/3-demethylubiquinone-9 3-methyltransferase